MITPEGRVEVHLQLWHPFAVGRHADGLLAYSPSAPYSAVLHVEGGQVEFGRDLLAEGVHEVAGVGGRFQVAPALGGAVAGQWLLLACDLGVFAARAREVARFVSESRLLVPAGAEQPVDEAAWQAFEASLMWGDAM